MNRKQAREEAFKILFESQINIQELDITEKSSDEYIIDVVSGTLEHILHIDEAIRPHLNKWTLERIAPIERTILRLSVYEMIYMEDIPKAVSINEAVELAHKYGDDKSSKFINGVLSKITKGEGSE